MDIATAEGQPLGIPLFYGGPYVGLLATSMRNVRQMPGRLAGVAHDAAGRRGFVLTLKPREQDIRRERATSNICTNEALIATAVAIYVAALGPNGLQEVADQCYHRSHYLAAELARLPGFSPRFSRVGICASSRSVRRGPRQRSIGGSGKNTGSSAAWIWDASASGWTTAGC